MNPELIECLKSFIRSKHLTNEWEIFRDNWFNEINSEASNESLSVRDNEKQKEFCHHEWFKHKGEILECYKCKEIKITYTK